MKKEISLKELEEMAKQVGLPKYPKYLGKGLWRISDNCITNQKGLEMYINKE